MRFSPILWLAPLLWLTLLPWPVAATERTHSSFDETRIAEEWLAALRAGDAKQAVALANRMVNTAALPATPADPKYPELFRNVRADERFLTGKFTHWDYQVWRDAFFFQQLVRPLVENQDDPMAVLFAALTAKVAPVENGKMKPAWPRRVWERGWGICDRMAWAMGEMAYQAGFEYQIVYLMNKEQTTSCHTIVELRDAKGGVWVADPYAGKLLARTSVDRLAQNEAVRVAFWPKAEQANYHEQICCCAFFTPAMPQDYCRRNQELYRKLAAALGERCPRFGADPRERLLEYRRRRQQELGDGLHYTMGLWFYPIAMLKDEMVREARELGLQSTM